MAAALGPRLHAAALSLAIVGASLWGMLAMPAPRTGEGAGVIFPSWTPTPLCSEVSVSAEQEVYRGLLVLGFGASSFTALENQASDKVYIAYRLNGTGSWWFEFPVADPKFGRWQGYRFGHGAASLAVAFRGSRAGRSCETPVGRYADKVQPTEILSVKLLSVDAL